MKYKSYLPRNILRRSGLYAALRGKRVNFYAIDGKKGVRLADRWTDLERAADLRPTDSLLDIGCAEGLITMEAAKKVRHATGIELIPARIGKAKELAAERGIDNVTFIKGSFFDLPAKTYDVVLMMAVFGNNKLVGARETGAFLKRARRSLYISLYDRHVGEVRAVAEENGFELVTHPAVFAKEDVIAECTRVEPLAQDTP